jgi:hypothetical protein
MMAELPYTEYQRPGYLASAKYFGYHMAAHGDHMAVSIAESGASRPNRVHLYRRDAAGAYSLLTTIDDPAASSTNGFGAKIAIYETSATDVLIAITAPYFSTPPYTGKLYIYRWNGSSASLEDTFVPTMSGVSQDVPYGGRAVACTGTFVAVCDSGQNQAGGTPTGMVYFYEKSGGSWGSVGTFYPTGHPDWTVYIFGYSIAIDESDPNFMLIGSPGDYVDDVNWYWSGASYLIERTGTSTYVERDRILPAEWAPYSSSYPTYFGISVAIDLASSRLAVGTYVDPTLTPSKPGGVYVYEGSVGSWSETFFKPADTDEAGQYVALLDDTVAFADCRQTITSYRKGCVYVFELNGSWTQAYKLDPDVAWGPHDYHGGRINGGPASGNIDYGNVVFPVAGSIYGGKLIGVTSHPLSYSGGSDESGAVFYYVYEEPPVPPPPPPPPTEYVPEITNESPSPDAIGVSSLAMISCDIFDRNDNLDILTVSVRVNGVLGFEASGGFLYPFTGLGSTAYATTVDGYDGYHVELVPVRAMSDLVTVQMEGEDAYGNAGGGSWSFSITGISKNFIYYSDGYGVHRIHISALAGESQDEAVRILSTDTVPALGTNQVTTLFGTLKDGYMYLLTSMDASGGVLITRNEVNDPRYYLDGYDAYGAQMTPDGTMYVINKTRNRVEAYYGADFRPGGREPDFIYDASSTPALMGGTLLDLHVAPGYSVVKAGRTRFYTGSSQGMTKVDTYDQEASDGYSAGMDGFGMSWTYGVAGSGADYEQVGSPTDPSTASQVVAVHSDDEAGLVFVLTEDGHGNGGLTQINISSNRRILFMNSQGGFLPSNYGRDVHGKNP